MEMNKPIVLVNRRIPGDLLQEMRLQAEIRLWDREEPIPKDKLLEMAAGVHGLLNISADPVDKALLDAAGHLRVVSNAAAGYDNMDLQEMNRRKVMGTNTPDMVTETTADLAFGLMLAAARRIAEADRFVRAGRWEGWRPSLMLGLDVHGAALGIVGMGRIGEAVARRAGGFGMKVFYHNRNRKPEAEARLGCAYKPLDDLLRTSDFICVLAPAQPAPIIRREHFALMKRSAIFINVSRGKNVDEQALVEALREGSIAGAGLDVYEKEPIAAGHPLLSMDNVVLTPHIGTASAATRRRMIELAFHNLMTALKGQRPPNLVNPEALDND